MSAERHLEVLQRVFDAFNRHDPDAIMSYFADDCVFESPADPIGGAADDAFIPGDHAFRSATVVSPGGSVRCR
jgi:hypothetical protein